MPSVSVKLYSVFFKALLKHKLLSQKALSNGKDASGPVRRPSNGVPANASFVDGVATKDINIDPFTSLTLRIFLPESALPQELTTPGNTGLFGCIKREADQDDKASRTVDRRTSYGGDKRKKFNLAENRRNSWGGERLQRSLTMERDLVRLGTESRSMNKQENQCAEAALHADPLLNKGLQSFLSNADVAHENYQGYHPVFTAENHKKLPIIVQFHGGGFVTGSKDSMANDLFCRRMAKLCDAIVVAVGYRLAPEHKYPAAFNDGFDALSWLAKQANLADCSKSLGQNRLFTSKADAHRKNDKELIKTFGGSTIVEPWLAAHGDPSRCVLLGVSSGGNIADFMARKAVQAGRLLEPIKIVAQVLVCPFFIGSIPTQSEIKLANSYFYDKATCILAWKLFFSGGEFNLDHLVANPLVAERELPLKQMPPTLTIVGELDWMKDRAIAYSEALRKVNLDAPVLEYKDAVHEFATLDFLVKSRQAEACAEDMTIWIKKYISQKGHEFSY